MPSSRIVKLSWNAWTQLQAVTADGPPLFANYVYDKAGRVTAVVHEHDRRPKWGHLNGVSPRGFTSQIVLDAEKITDLEPNASRFGFWIQVARNFQLKVTLAAKEIHGLTSVFSSACLWGAYLPTGRGR